jgi:hypothetical protein
MCKFCSLVRRVHSWTHTPTLTSHVLTTGFSKIDAADLNTGEKSTIYGVIIHDQVLK